MKKTETSGGRRETTIAKRKRELMPLLFAISLAASILVTLVMKKLE
jgi:hypothetical protein